MKNKIYPELLVADRNGKISNVPFLEGCGMKAGSFYRFSKSDLKPLPPCSQLFMLPGRVAVAVDPMNGEVVHLKEHPSFAGEPCFPVAAFLSPGHTGTFSAAFLKGKSINALPLFCYTAVVFYKGEFYAPSVRVDYELRQDPRYMDLALMQKNIQAFKKIFPRNRLVVHLENCACVNGCPAAKNFFLKRYEAPLPTSPTCNAQCLGCISFQPKKKIPVTQPRIRFVPTPEEIAEVALYHMKNVKDPVVSFGQGCEGEPLMVAETIEKAIRIIRQHTRKGMINLNTNASRPLAVARLCDAGLDSMRVSLNSTQKELYHAYYNPRDYVFSDVLRSIDTVKGKGGFVSLNYLVMPGLTDSQQEYQSLRKLLLSRPIDMIQWRNLNFDPLAYFRILDYGPDPAGLLGVNKIIDYIHKEFPHLMRGYFNPSRARIRRHQNLSM
jgi:pyruvate-formate lyase-activating enzyme